MKWLAQTCILFVRIRSLYEYLTFPCAYPFKVDLQLLTSWIRLELKVSIAVHKHVQTLPRKSGRI